NTKVKNESVKNVLKRCLSATNINFKLENKSLLRWFLVYF
ncbi:MAG: hypothetical protein ACI9LN_003257, partial [Saprospiraceae bacterium]